MPLIFSEATQLKFDHRVLSLSYTSSSENTHYTKPVINILRRLVFSFRAMVKSLHEDFAFLVWKFRI